MDADASTVWEKMNCSHNFNQENGFSTLIYPNIVLSFFTHAYGKLWNTN